MKKLALLAIVLGLTGCATQRFDVGSNPQNAATYDDSQSFWVSGIGQSQDIDAAKVCGNASKVQRVETQQTAGNAALSILTLGIYTPRQIRVYCTR